MDLVVVVASEVAVAAAIVAAAICEFERAVATDSRYRQEQGRSCSTDMQVKARPRDGGTSSNARARRCHPAAAGM